jgi:hypothetical protein
VQKNRRPEGREGSAPKAEAARAIRDAGPCAV